MSLKKEIDDFHKNIKYQLPKQSISTLQDHKFQIGTSNVGNRRNMVKVKAFHYALLSSKRSKHGTLFRSDEIIWEDIEQNQYYFEKELIEFALLCLYLTNIPLGECIVKRVGKKDIVVVRIQEIMVEQLTNTQQEFVRYEIQKHSIRRGITFGADLELMLKNEKSKKFMNADILTSNEFGFDQAIAVNNHQVFHPIVEIRPKPAVTMVELHMNLLTLYQQFESQAAKYQLSAITDPNPIGRFFLGGHLHFGNIPFTFQHVRLLDQFVTIPFALVERNPSVLRRQSYGRLGSVRENDFQGFEYRVLPTWYQHIPSCLPLLLWVEYLLKNSEEITTRLIDQKFIKAYYNQEKGEKLFDQWVNENRDMLMEDLGKSLFDDYISYLKNL
ncbi:hypothetical protein H1D32_20635 [Anaerobacillus sp. CMMVII]|uniref:putative amidoligase domain-containing protein n=1 Tax=Anaerobacillus sp. CMMVII TaxID=2755588 RepID=UPI0021B80EFD|nr:hypothetical protein [Anaerobacillus sp. CMMVII]MCT8139895.1 hypothetical protein [Anaerobacillus sp. CMMVII]